MKHYTDRAQKVVQIEKIENGIVHWDDGWVFGGVPEDVLPLLAVGDMYIMETRDHPRHRGHRNFSMVVGMATNTPDPVWLWRKTDEQLDQEHKEMVSGFQRRRQEELDKHREDWTKREAALPEPLRARLQRFRDSGGDFDRDGWGYELVICELAVLYHYSNQEDTEDIKAYARREGTSGNQHDYAKALSRELAQGHLDVVANSVSALSPITGDPDYSGKKVE
jgi:hypothetical protein